jgi:hypothetical protein
VVVVVVVVVMLLLLMLVVEARERREKLDGLYENSVDHSRCPREGAAEQSLAHCANCSNGVLDPLMKP